MVKTLPAAIAYHFPYIFFLLYIIESTVHDVECVLQKKNNLKIENEDWTLVIVDISKKHSGRSKISLGEWGENIHWTVSYCPI